MPADDDRTEVLTSLPRSRPQRRSARRENGDSGTEPAAAKATRTAAKKPRAAAKPRASAAKTSAATSGASKPAKGGAARTRVAAPKAAAKPKPKPKATAAAKTTKANPKATAPRTSATPRPEAVKGPPREDRSRPVEPPSGADVLQSVVQAAGEITQVGVTIWREAAKSVIKRLPRP